MTDEQFGRWPAGTGSLLFLGKLNFYDLQAMTLLTEADKLCKLPKMRHNNKKAHNFIPSQYEMVSSDYVVQKLHERYTKWMELYCSETE